ncbi:hypothetical protein CDHC03_0252 [Corynebacterium diphtheriae HC03]|nr:hypothetical protein CDHC03_0252 [Corynebacterium diphtheriae HC03]AEX80228.1 hypothetical protein CDHC04_0235 [Corynebacterium diphtheriae HC04]
MATGRTPSAKRHFYEGDLRVFFAIKKPRRVSEV